jgi:poly(3-hydroxybutyrate) depolymerase
MIPKRQTRRKERNLDSSKRTTGRCIACVCFLATLFTSSTAFAGWNVQPERIAAHPTWIYTPDSTLSGNDKRGLMVVLHGCAQTHDQIKEGGNLQKAAEEFGLVMAVPYVTKVDGYLLDCWDYDGIDDNHGHLAEIVAVTEELRSRDALNIDPNHVYVVGLSSGGALALKLGCKAPGVFAGIGAIAGPSVGSNQSQATVDGKLIPNTNISNAISTCRSLAATSSSHFATQIVNIAYGDMDKNGPAALTDCAAQTHPGQNCVVSIRYSMDNIEILKEIYGAGELGPRTSVQGGKGTQQSATSNGETVLSLLVIHGVGHAWPAGSGTDNSAVYGQYVAQKGLNYSLYAAEWLIAHNRRIGPIVTCDEPAVAGTSVRLSCSAGGPNPISSYHVIVSGPSPQDDTLPGEPTFTKQYDNLADGSYTAEVTANDSQGNNSQASTGSFKIPEEGVKCVTSDNVNHVDEGRAAACGLLGFWACATGSGDDLGLNYSFFTSSVKQTGPDYWIEVTSCPTD